MPLYIPVFNKMSKKSQSALEYMMTYGWAILIIVIVAAGLYSLGIFSPTNSASTSITGFSNFGVQAQCIQGGALQIQITNGIGNLINITKINTTSSLGQKVNLNISVVLPPSQSQMVFIPGACTTSQGSSYSNQVSFTYKEPGQIFIGPYFSTGTVSGTSVKNIQTTVAGFEMSSNAQKSTIRISDGEIATGVGTYDTVSFWLRWAGYYAETPIAFQNSELYIVDPSCFGFNTFASDVYGTSLLQNQWIYVTAIFYNGNYTGNAQMYLNGTAQTLTQCWGTSHIVSTSSNVYISGSSGALYTLNFGKMADIQIYNTKLSPSQVSTLYSEGIGGAPLSNAGLVGWWPLNGNANDYSGNNNNGVAINVTWVSP